MRPIDADALKERYENTTDCALVCIDEAPTLDVRPNIHAHWIKSNDPNLPFICSNCCEYMKEDTPFCPDCGAEMDEEVEE